MVVLFLYTYLGPLTINDKKIIHLIIENNLPFNMVNSQSFKAAFSHNNNAQILDESHYRFIFLNYNLHLKLNRKIVLPEVNKQVQSKIKTELLECDYLSFTADAWSGPTESFMGFSFNIIKFKYDNE
jgi:hypothetical protein